MEISGRKEREQVEGEARIKGKRGGQRRSERRTEKQRTDQAGELWQYVREMKRGFGLYAPL